MDRAPTKKELTHDRIVDVAAKAIRRRGYDGVGVADVMKEAGLTHGGFYAHFESREALLIEAIQRAARSSAASMARRRTSSQGEGIGAFRALVEGYLHDDLLKAIDAGCPVAALCSEMPRQAPDVRKASAAHVRALLAYVAKVLPGDTSADDAAVVSAALVGSLQLARAVGSIVQGRAILASARAHLIDRYDRT